ncbi:MAG: hypothetical protein AABY13_03410 [Nanoarchaeota archaeon]
MGRKHERKNSQDQAKAPAPGRRFSGVTIAGVVGVAVLGAAFGLVTCNNKTYGNKPRVEPRRKAPVKETRKPIAHYIDGSRIAWESLPVTYTDLRENPATQENVRSQSLLVNAIDGFRTQRLPGKVGTPQRLEVMLHSVQERQELLSEMPPGYDQFVRDAQALVDDARITIRTVPHYPAPGIKFKLATKDDDTTVLVDYREFLTNDVTIYIAGSHTADIVGTVRVHGTGQVQFNADVTHTQHLAGDVIEHMKVTAKGGKVYPALWFSPVTHYWSGGTPASLDNILGEYLHCVVSPRTVQHSSAAYAAHINATGMSINAAHAQQLFNSIFRKYDLLEEAIVHGAAHSVTKHWLQEHGMPLEEFGANYRGVREIEEHCDKVGIVQLLNEYVQQPDELIKLANIKHDAPEGR